VYSKCLATLNGACYRLSATNPYMLHKRTEDRMYEASLADFSPTIKMRSFD